LEALGRHVVYSFVLDWATSYHWSNINAKDIPKSEPNPNNLKLV